ncbi:MAG TPA: protein-glutamate O-methyltransferase [Spirochaetota bacterium]|nr:protein-glutamate O-methyltransferase [Spirochaetota bacterium]HPJ34362.1 protein-glutamate O-methyltransferase [Spirochaetota bacterium]
MQNEVKNNLSVSFDNSTMSDKEFSLFSSMIYSVTGIKLPPVKKLMLISRLNKRMKALEIKTYGEYYDYVCSPAGKSGEYHKMIDAVTTNKTEFFREPEHFSILRDRVLPELSSTDRFRQGNPINIWSAGCSTGEEPYTIAMVTSEYFMEERASVSILATDISTKVLSTAINGVYPEKIIDPIPLALKKKYVLRGKGENKGVFRMTPEIRRMINFSKLNLMDERFIFNREMDIVFCRNVIIYFDRDTQIKLFDKFYDIITPGGYLFIGSSETLHGLNDRFKPVGPTVYIKR